MKLNPPNEFRFRQPGNPFHTDDVDGMNGAFTIPLKGFGHKILAHCIVSNGFNPDGNIPWEHVSVHIQEYGKQRTPTWAEMCVIKDIFWDEEECVVQYHPSKSNYVNIHPHVLHIWKPTVHQLPIPPKMCV